MASREFAGSSGLLDIQPPSWVANDMVLFASWGQLLLSLVKHGSVRTLKHRDSVALEPLDLGLVVDGGLFATNASLDAERRTIFVGFFQRGDLFTTAFGNDLKISLAPHHRTTLLVVDSAHLDAFKADFPAWDRMLLLLGAGLSESYICAVQETRGKDVERIKRSINLMAEHPTATDSEIGRVVEAGKQLIRELSGVQKRSATRAFRALEDSGVISFWGYKRLILLKRD